MKANDRFNNRMEVLQKFGFQGEGLRQALWRIPNQTNRYLWFAHLGEYVGGLNTLNKNGEMFTDRRDPKAAGADNYGVHASADIERILFLITTRFGRNVVEFAGVFKPDLPNSVYNVSAWMRVSDECSLPDGSWQPSVASK